MLREQLRGLRWDRIALRPLVAAALMGGLVLSLYTLPLLVNVAIGVATYAGLLLVLGVIGTDELRFVRALRRPAASGS
jgi:hypothetical protein